MIVLFFLQSLNLSAFSLGKKITTIYQKITQKRTLFFKNSRNYFYNNDSNNYKTEILEKLTYVEHITALFATYIGDKSQCRILTIL